MKNVISIISLLITLFSCGQTSELSSTSKLGGVYNLKLNEGEDRVGVVYVYPETSSTILFFMDLNAGAPSYNSGRINGRIEITTGRGVFNDADFPDCKFKFSFVEDKLIVETVEDKYDCPFGNRVFADGEFNRESSITPEYYEIDGEKVYFKDFKKNN
jgi:hypothetical protein